MIRLLLVALIVLATTGMSCSRYLGRPIPAQCAPMGFEVCKSQARWAGNPNDPAAWDALAADTLSDSRAETRTCEQRRLALQQCLERLERQRLIDLGRP